MHILRCALCWHMVFGVCRMALPDCQLLVLTIVMRSAAGTQCCCLCELLNTAVQAMIHLLELYVRMKTQVPASTQDVRTA